MPEWLFDYGYFYCLLIEPLGNKCDKYLNKTQVFPTPESPMRSNLKRRSISRIYTFHFIQSWNHFYTRNWEKLSFHSKLEKFRIFCKKWIYSFFADISTTKFVVGQISKFEYFNPYGGKTIQMAFFKAKGLRSNRCAVVGVNIEPWLSKCKLESSRFTQYGSLILVIIHLCKYCHVL